MNDEVTVSDLPVQEEVAKEAITPGDSIDLEPIQRFFFGRNEPETSDKEDMAIMWKYFTEQSSGPGEALGKLRDLERSLSTPPPGVSRLQHLASYVRLLVSEDDIKKEMSAYYG